MRQDVYKESQGEQLQALKTNDAQPEPLTPYPAVPTQHLPGPQVCSFACGISAHVHQVPATTEPKQIQLYLVTQGLQPLR